MRENHEYTPVTNEICINVKWYESGIEEAEKAFERERQGGGLRHKQNTHGRKQTNQPLHHAGYYSTPKAPLW